MSSFIIKAKYLGSPILPSPIEMEVTIALNDERIEIPEIQATVYLDRIEKVIAIKGSELAAQTLMMVGIVGLIINNDRPHVIMEIKEARANKENATTIEQQ